VQKRKNALMARPSSLTDSVRAELERDLAQGVPVVVAAQRVGRSPRTVHAWLERGLVARRRLSAAPEPEPALDDDDDERIQAALMGVVMKAAQRGSWTAARWVLEQRWPSRYAKRS
jgi:hypothetical protein